MSALTLPRLRVRRRRKRPKPLDWWFWALLYVDALGGLARDALKLVDEASAGRAVGVGSSVLLACAWRRAMRHADPDDDCTADWRRVVVFCVGGAALAVARLFA